MSKVKTKVLFALEQRNQPPEVKPYLVPLVGWIPVFTSLLDFPPPRLASARLWRVLLCPHERLLTPLYGTSL